MVYNIYLDYKIQIKKSDVYIYIRKKKGKNVKKECSQRRNSENSCSRSASKTLKIPFVRAS